MNVLVLAPHPDDESIGCGGALCLHADAGDRVVVAFLTSGELGLKDLPGDEASAIREAEARVSAQILGVKNVTFLRLPDSQLTNELPRHRAALTALVEREKPEWIYFPHAHEWHPDHKAVAHFVRQLPTTAELRAYEIWTPLQGPTEIVDVTTVWERKTAAIRAHASQMRQWRYERAVQGLNQYRSAMSGKDGYAEAYARGV